jgi:hypothetical protein
MIERDHMSTASKQSNQRLIVASCVIIGATVAYILSDFGDWPKLTYWPQQQRWAFANKTTDGAMAYWGGILWALGGALVSVPLAWVLQRWNAGRNATILLGAWAIAALLIASLYVVWMLWPF